MKKPKPYSLRIDSPCLEQWDSMLQVPSGKYCLHCAKTVIDCTDLTDAEIDTVVQQQRANGKATFCGRFKGKQIARPLVLPQQQRSSYFALPVLIAGALSLITPEQTTAQDIPASMKCEQKKVPQAQNTASSSDTTKKSVLPILVPDSTTIVGYIKDRNWDALSGATIQVLGTTYEVTSKADGSFSINNIPKGIYTLRVKMKGFDTRTISYNTIYPSVVTLVLTAYDDSDDVMGLVGY